MFTTDDGRKRQFGDIGSRTQSWLRWLDDLARVLFVCHGLVPQRGAHRLFYMASAVNAIPKTCAGPRQNEPGASRCGVSGASGVNNVSVGAVANV